MTTYRDVVGGTQALSRKDRVSQAGREPEKGVDSIED